MKIQDQRFWDKVNYREPDECWEWQGARTGKNYGKVKRRGIRKSDIVKIHKSGLCAGSIRFMYKGETGWLKVRLNDSELLVITAFTDYMYNTEEWNCGNFSVDMKEQCLSLLGLWDKVLNIIKRNKK